MPGPVDAVAHLASPASPPDYARLPLETLAVGSRGTENALRLALRHGARFLLASTSEVYGDPVVHPQPEEYWGNVNPVGPRSVYDEAKRYAEALTTAYRTGPGADTGIVRIFNTYGPRMRPRDGRVVSTFLRQALSGRPLTVYGDGGQTRSFCYVDDLVRGLTAMLDAHCAGPVNLGNPVECTVSDLARLVLRVTGSGSPVVHRPLPVDDPGRRRPDIARAAALLGWRPEVPCRRGCGAPLPGSCRRCPVPPSRPGRDTVSGRIAVALAGTVLAVAGAGCLATPHYQPTARTYYVSPDGDDEAAGTSPGRAWRTLERAERTALEPGDRLLLRGGARFPGTVTVGAHEAGDAARPVVVGSYGGGRATVSAGRLAGVSVHNTAGVEIHDLVVQGAGARATDQAGVNLHTDEGGRRRHVVVSGVDVSGFRVGVSVGSTAAGSGFRDVTVRRATLHGNRDAGLLTYGPVCGPTAPTTPTGTSRWSGSRRSPTWATLPSTTGTPAAASSSAVCGRPWCVAPVPTTTAAPPARARRSGRWACGRTTPPRC